MYVHEIVLIHSDQICYSSFCTFFFSSFFPLLQGQVGSKLQKFVFNRKIEYSKGEKILQLYDDILDR